MACINQKDSWSLELTEDFDGRTFAGRTFASWSSKRGAESLLPVWTHSALSYIAHDAAFARGFLLPGPIIAKCAGVGRMERWRGRVWKVLMWTNTLSADSAGCPEAKQSMGVRQSALGKSLRSGLLPKIEDLISARSARLYYTHIPCLWIP